MMWSHKYYDFKLCYFPKDVKKPMKILNECPEINNKLKELHRKISQNLKIFNHNLQFPCRMLIKKMCSATIYENVSYASLINNWRIFEVQWLVNTKAENREAILIHVIIGLADIFKTKILKKLFYVQDSLKSYKINYFPINKYRSLYSKSINEMIRKKQLLPLTKVHSASCKSKLKIIPKSQMTSHRPLVRTGLLSTINMNNVKELLKNRGATFDRNMYTAWSRYVQVSKNQQIYGIEMDLKDAFSHVDIEKLKPLIKKFLKTEPGSRDAILNSLKNQPVRVYGNQLFQWNRGLMQGMRLSAQLCDLSRSFFDMAFLKLFINENNFFHRTVDDYFFCSVNKEDVLRVKEILEKYCVVSHEKTQSNLEDNTKIVYNGRAFNLKTKEIEIHVDGNLQTYRYKSKLFYKKFVNTSNQYEYLKEIGGLKINAYNFDKLLLNLNFNSKETVLQNYFKAMIIVAFKIDCAIKERLEEIPEDLDIFIINLIKFYVRYTRIKIKKEINQNEPMNVKRKVLKFIGIKSFILVLQKRYMYYKSTIIYLKGLIRKTKDSMLRTKFNKFPEEFNNIVTKRVLPQYV